MDARYKIETPQASAAIFSLILGALHHPTSLRDTSYRVYYDRATYDHPVHHIISVGAGLAAGLQLKTILRAPSPPVRAGSGSHRSDPVLRPQEERNSASAVYLKLMGVRTACLAA